MSDSPLPIPSGYFCHTSCAIGKGRQPQQYDCPLSFSLSPSPSIGVAVLSYPNFTPESQYLLITLEGIVPCTFSFRALYISVPVKTLKKNRRRPSVASLRHSQLFYTILLCSLAREGSPRLSAMKTPHDSLFLGAHLSCRMGMSTGTERNSTKLENGMGVITSSWLEFK